MNTKIIEINGIKMEVDCRSAEVSEITSFKVGSQVRLLKKEYDDYKTYPGVVIGFDNFKSLPTIVIAYLKKSYNDCSIEYAYINAESKHEIVPSNEKMLEIDKQTVVDAMEKEILSLEQKKKEAEAKLTYFLEYFNQYFGSDD